MKNKFLLFTMLLTIGTCMSQTKKLGTSKDDKIVLEKKDLSDVNSKPTEKELNEVLYSDAEIDSAIKFSVEYWQNLKGKTLKDVIETDVEPQQRSTHRKRKTIRQINDECNPFHKKWWKRH